jgi:hypothetical protein
MISIFKIYPIIECIIRQIDGWKEMHSIIRVNKLFNNIGQKFIRRATKRIKNQCIDNTFFVDIIELYGVRKYFGSSISYYYDNRPKPSISIHNSGSECRTMCVKHDEISTSFDGMGNGPHVRVYINHKIITVITYCKYYISVNKVLDRPFNINMISADYHNIKISIDKIRSKDDLYDWMFLTFTTRDKSRSDYRFEIEYKVKHENENIYHNIFHVKS